MINQNFNSQTQNSTETSSTNLRTIPDKNLYQLCKNYGYESLKWRWKFTGLLPEVYRRKLYEKKGFESIFVFAKKLAGISEEQVRRVLNLEEKFSAMPNLQNLLIQGEVSTNKLARVASIATTQNEKCLAEKMKILSQAAIETLVRDEKFAQDAACNQNGLFESEKAPKSVRTHTFLQSNFSTSSSQNLQLSPEVKQKLLELQNKGFDINQLILDLLQKREEEIAAKKAEISRKVLQREEQKSRKAEKISEYVLKNPLQKHRPSLPVPVKKILKEEYGKKCAIGHCQKPAENIHHTLPFSISRSHDPKFLIPLCKEHHELQHAINSKYQLFHISRHPQHPNNNRHMQQINN